ncbi:MAG: metallophosphoesterase family protein [Clostridia bacterium]|nr:metallophosphoesterase family protein [Clostridia bacterium]
MNIAILSDIHGNIFALRKCIEYIEKIKIDSIIFCGDYISDIPRSHEVISCLKELSSKYKCYFIKGNRENYVIDYLKSNKKNWTIDNRNAPMLCTLNELTEEDIAFIEKLPDSIGINIEGHPAIYVRHKRIENSNEFCAEFAVLNVDNNQSNLEFINIKYDMGEVIKSIKDSELSNTRIKWDQILIKTIECGVDYSELYIKKVLENAKKIGISDIDDIPMNIWDEAEIELFK